MQAMARKTHSAIHQPKNGIIPLLKKHVQKIEIGRVIKFVNIKNRHEMFVVPATIHKISSGKIGNNIIKKNTYLPCPIFCDHFSKSFSPAIQIMSFFPTFLPRKNEKQLASIIEMKLRKSVIHGPKIIVPAIVVAAAGIGIKVA